MLINLEFGFSAFGSSSPSYVVCSMRGNCAMQETYATVTNTAGPILILPMLVKVGCSSYCISLDLFRLVGESPVNHRTAQIGLHTPFC